MRKGIIALTGIFLASGLTATAQHSDLVHQRQALMKSNQEGLRSLTGMSRGQVPFDAASARRAMQTIRQNAEKIPSMFPANSFEGETNALPIIQDRKTDFDSRALNLIRDVQAAENSTSDQASLQAALQTVGKNCGGCHEVYRKKLP